MRVLYSALLYCLTPFALARLLWRSWREPEYRARLGERFGFLSGNSGAPPLWLHAVSVGEVVAALPLIEALREAHPEVPLVVSTTTPSGAGLLAARCGDRVHHVYMPFDLPGAMRRAYRRLEPRALVLLETELWPNLVAEATCPVLLLNARLSARSALRYGRFAGLTAPMLQALTHIACQSHADADRFLELGAPRANVSVCGNLKAEQRSDAAAVAALRQRWCRAEQHVLVAGSTHDGEESVLLSVFATLRERHPDCLLVLAPRHIERGGTVARLARDAGWRVARASAAPAPADVLVVDTLGELASFYALATVAYVGGSLVERGGHNLLEPALQGVPIVAGPHLYNFTAAAQALQAAGALRIVVNEQELLATLQTLFAAAGLRES
ncbi:MAG: 3-deoxy-D-manno-octulosonic acid transferase, partial [Halioglobus sp.]|nr:3-deoxy-D-manno-octulosonic acid transferase [Halioglobus sp.]